MAISETRVESLATPAPGRVVVAVTFVTLGLTYGVWYSYSVLLVALLREFGWSRSVLAGAFSVFVMVHGLYAALIGVGYAATAPLTPAVASDLFGGPRFARIFGVLHATNSLGGAAGAWAAGRIFDATGSYAVGLWVIAIMTECAPALLWVAAPWRANPPPGGR